MQTKAFHSLFAAAILAGILATAPWEAIAQSTGRVIEGKVTDAFGEPLPGAAVMVQGSTTGTVTDMDGKYRLILPEGSQTLQISYLGYDTETVTLTASNTVNVTLVEDIATLGDVVVIGYGTQRKGDLTGAISNVTADDFNQGLIGSPEQLINGKVSGVQITSAGGSPTSGSTIKIRGGASLNASNDPLIVLDGVPLENGGISGNSSNFLSLINPADIESMTVLKDASSTAIYGSRASNGVIIITTKKGANTGIKVSLTTTHSIQKAYDFADMMSRSEFIQAATDAGYASMLGTADTDWNDEVFGAAYGTDNNISISGSIAKKVPIRFSAGYYNQKGILMTDKAQRITGNLNISPTLLDEHLKLTLSLKGTLSKNRFASTSAIWGAATYDPTQTVYATYEGADQFNGYTEAVTYTRDAVTGEVTATTPVSGATLNPVGLLEQTDDKSDVNRIVGNIDVDYSMHFLPELRAHVTFGYDYGKGEGSVTTDPKSAGGFLSGGSKYEYGPQKLYNRLLTAYLNYNKELNSSNKIDFTAGYDFQFFKSETPAFDYKTYAGEVQSTSKADEQRHAMLSYYGRLNYTLLDKYMLTATIRRDGTSRFNEDNRWGTFPSVALAWRLNEEGFLQNVESLSTLKLRASYGVTGQQEGIGNYAYQPIYVEGTSTNRYVFGNEAVTTYAPRSYVDDLKWETTKAWNFGIDFGFFNNRLSGSAEYYTRKTEDLLATVSVAAGVNFDKSVLTNVGNVDSQGFEFTLNGTPIDNDDWTLDMTFNAAWQTQKVKNLSLVENAEITNTYVGSSVDGKQVQVLTEGYAPYMFYVYHQLYDKDGKPIEGAYADINGDGEINTSDLYRFHSPAPDWMMGFSLNLRWRKLTLGTSLRSSIGNYVYNAMSMNTGALETMKYNDSQLNNMNRSYLQTNFSKRQHYSDYYVENASFLKMDNVTLGYNFGKIADVFSMNASFMVQNVFTVTNYTGVDPEVDGGIDQNFYPRPRIFSLSLGFEF